MKEKRKTTCFMVEVKHTRANHPKYLREDLLELWKWDDDIKIKVKRVTTPIAER